MFIILYYCMIWNFNKGFATVWYIATANYLLLVTFCFKSRSLDGRSIDGPFNWRPFNWRSFNWRADQLVPFNWRDTVARGSNSGTLLRDNYFSLWRWLFVREQLKQCVTDLSKQICCSCLDCVRSRLTKFWNKRVYQQNDKLVNYTSVAY